MTKRKYRSNWLAPNAAKTNNSKIGSPKISLEYKFKVGDSAILEYRTIVPIRMLAF